MKHFLSLLLALLGFTTASAQIIPLYDTIGATPADGTTVSALTTITVSLSREGYDAPIGIMPGAAAVEAVRIEGANEIQLPAPKASVKGGQLLVTFAEPYATAGSVVIRIPEGMTNNLAMPVANMTTQEIIDEGGCTNPAITLTYNVQPAILAVKDVTGIGYDTQYLTDEQGNFIKDEKGQYIRQDKYDSLIDAQLTPGTDRVTVIYFWYDQQFATIDYNGGASVVNTTTGRPCEIAKVSFKTGGDSHRNNVIELRLSSENFIEFADAHQGVYQVTLPEGIATTADGLKNGGITFSFTFGNPDEAYFPEEVDLDPYIGQYEAVVEAGEQPTGEHFTFAKTDDGTYYITDLCGSTLNIPVKPVGEKFYLGVTESDEGEAFMDLRGGDVQILFHTNEGDRYIYIDQYALFMPHLDGPLFGGIINFKQQPAPIIDRVGATLSAATAPTAAYDLQGRQLTPAQQSKPGAAPSLIITRERKVMQ